jgi:hypothetical protein
MGFRVTVEHGVVAVDNVESFLRGTDKHRRGIGVAYSQDQDHVRLGSVGAHKSFWYLWLLYQTKSEWVICIGCCKFLK